MARTTRRRSAGLAVLAAACAGLLAPAGTAGTITAAGNALTFTAGAGETNSVTVSVSAASYTITDTTAITGSISNCSGEGTTTLTCSDALVSSISLALGDQGDSVSIRSMNDPVVVSGGTGDESITVGDPGGAPANTVDGIRAALTVNGDAGSDTVTLQDFGDTSGDIVTITATQLGAGAGDSLFGTGGSLAYATLEALTVNFGQDGDNVRVIATAAGATTTLQGGSGGDIFGLSSDGNGTSGNLDGLAGAILVQGGSGTNTLQVADETSAAPNAVTLTPSQIAGLAPVAIGYEATGGFGGGIVVRGSDLAADTVAITGTLAGGATEVRTLGGGDTVAISSDGTGTAGDLDTVAGALVVDLGAGANSLLVSDLAEAGPGANATVVIDADSIDGLAGPTDASAIGYAATGGTVAALAVTTSASAAVAERISVSGPLGPLALAAGEGPDAVEVRSLIRTATIDAGGGDDVLTVGDPSGTLDGVVAPIAVIGGPGANALTLTDTADSSADTVTITASQVGASAEDNLFGTGGALTYSGIAALTVRTGTANDVVVAAATAPGTQTSVAAGAGDDGFTVGSGTSVAAIASPLSLDGGEGVNTLLVNDSGDDSGDRLTLGTDTIGLGEGDTFFGPGGGMRQAGMVTVSIVTGAGPDVLVLAGAPLGGIATAGGDDRVVLEPDATLAGTLDGGPGTDTLDYTAWTTAAFVNLGSGEASGTGGVAGFERVEGGGGNDSITGQYSAPSVLLGFGGNDRLTGGSGTDLLDGGAGNDSLSGSFADDRYVLGAGGADRVTDNAGRDTLDFSSAPSAVRVDLSLRKGERQRLGKSKATLRLSGDVEHVVGSRFADVLVGSGAANHLQGGGGKDSLTGRRGDDRLDGGAGRDTLVERADAHFALSAKRLVGVGKDTLTSIESGRLTGGVSANRIVVKGFRGAVALAGGAGDDVLVGGPKADRLAGGAGDDTLDGGPGRDAVDGGAGFDTSVPDAADRLLAVETAG